MRTRCLPAAALDAGATARSVSGPVAAVFRLAFWRLGRASGRAGLFRSPPSKKRPAWFRGEFFLGAAPSDARGAAVGRGNGAPLRGDAPLPRGRSESRRGRRRVSRSAGAGPERTAPIAAVPSHSEGRRVFVRRFRGERDVGGRGEKARAPRAGGAFRRLSGRPGRPQGPRPDRATHLAAPWAGRPVRRGRVSPLAEGDRAGRGRASALFASGESPPCGALARPRRRARRRRGLPRSPPPLARPGAFLRWRRVRRR